MPNNRIFGYVSELKGELKLLVAVFAVVAAVMKIAYVNEGIADVLRVSASLFWLFIVPGYFLTLYWKESLGFVERTVFGSVAAIAVVGITSYYLGLIGLKLQSQTTLLPLAITALSFAACLKSWARKNPQQQRQTGQR